VRNFGRMRERRTVFQFGVHYETAVEALAAIPAEVRRIVEAQAQTRFDRCHFLTYGDTALQFELVYFVCRPEFNAYADVQQAINLALLARLRALGIRLAAPTRTVVYVENPAASAGATAPPLR